MNFKTKKKTAKRSKKETVSEPTLYTEMLLSLVVKVKRFFQEVAKTAEQIQTKKEVSKNMAHVFQVRIQTKAERIINVVAETVEEAQTKAAVNPDETVVEVVDAGEVTL